MDIRILWIWISLKFSPGTMKISYLLDEYGGIEEIYNEEKYTYSTYLTLSERKKLADKSLEAAYDICKRAEKANVKILVYDDEKYPESLRQLDSPPYVLYVKGKVIDWDSYVLISVIGTRNCTEYGVKATRKIAGELAEKGIVIVSGLARGLDSVAAVEALKHNCYCIGVLGCAIDSVYPPENRKLFNAIEKTGILISEYPPGGNTTGKSFVARNRIIAGLSRGLLVTEAPLKSGTGITVRFAYDYSRDVFAVPGSIFESNSAGTNKLLQGSAKAVMCAQDIIEEYPDINSKLRAPMGNIFIKELPELEGLVEKGLNEISKKKTFKADREKAHTNSSPRRNPPKAAEEKIDKTSEKEAEEKNKPKELPIGLNDEEQRIAMSLLGGERPKDEIIRETGLDAGYVNTALIMMEMQGVVEQLSGNVYRLIILKS